jgi:hypothetical protein
MHAAQIRILSQVCNDMRLAWVPLPASPAPELPFHPHGRCNTPLQDNETCRRWRSLRAALQEGWAAMQDDLPAFCALPLQPAQEDKDIRKGVCRYPLQEFTSIAMYFVQMQFVVLL